MLETFDDADHTGEEEEEEEEQEPDDLDNVYLIQEAYGKVWDKIIYQENTRKKVELGATAMKIERGGLGDYIARRPMLLQRGSTFFSKTVSEERGAP